MPLEETKLDNISSATGVFTTRDEFIVCPVLTVLQANLPAGSQLGFTYKEGSYEVYVIGALPHICSGMHCSLLAICLASCKKALPLSSFRQLNF